MVFIAGFGLGILVTIGVALIVSGDIDNNTDFR
jgi:ABC-type tungstate transport system substrate-binding protein